MPQKITTSVGLTNDVKKELDSRKKALSARIGRSISYDETIRALLGWKIQ